MTNASRLDRYCGRGMLLAALALSSIVAATTPGRAQTDYPNRPVHLVVGFAAGGGNDIMARLVAAKLSELLGQAAVVENKPGAGGRLAAEYVSNQAADGYTLLVGASGAMSVAAAIYPDLKYHPTRTLTPLAELGSYPMVMTVGTGNPSRTVDELVAWAKAHPDKANYASTSPAFTITTELLKLKTGMPGVMVPYKSSTEMVFSVVQDQTMTALADAAAAVPQVKAGKVKALAVTGTGRSEELPDVPSMAEAGYPDVDVRLWNGVFAPAATPAAVVAKLEKALSEAIRDPGVSAKLKNIAVEPGGGPPEEFRRKIDSDIVKFMAVVKAANLHFDEQ
jgi:tripartite-type tricarboxylate transporter receptor subunit TctC